MLVSGPGEGAEKNRHGYSVVLCLLLWTLLFHLFPLKGTSQTDNAASPQKHVPNVTSLNAASRCGVGGRRGRDEEFLSSLLSSFREFDSLNLECMLREEGKGGSLPFAAR